MYQTNIAARATVAPEFLFRSIYNNYCIVYKLRTALCQTHSSVYCSFRDPVTTQLRCASVFHPFRCQWISIRHSSSSVSTSSSCVFFQFFSTHFVITTPHSFFRHLFATVMWRCCYCRWMSQEMKNNQIDSSVGRSTSYCYFISGRLLLIKSRQDWKIKRKEKEVVPSKCRE